MTREELLAAVNEKEDTAKLTSLSQQTIDEELDDLLSDYGEGEEPDDKAVEKLARRMKRMAGNIHAGVSAEMKKNREEAERRRKGGKARLREDVTQPGEKDGEGEMPDGNAPDYSALEARLNSLMERMEARDKEARKASVEASVRRGLKSKFDEAGLQVNDFFVDIAIGKLDMDADADVASLVDKAEKIYTSDYKRAMGKTGMPRAGSGRNNGEEQSVSLHEWDDIKAMCKERGAGGRVR